MTNSLASRFPELLEEWHPTKNGDLNPASLIAGTPKKVWWKCNNGQDHEWQESPEKRTKRGHGCPYCSNHRLSITNSLATQNASMALEWHPTKNGELTPSDIVAGSNKKIWWKCKRNPNHEWLQRPNVRSTGVGCPFCNSGWTIEKVRLFVRSLRDHLNHLTPAELYLIFQQSGLLDSMGKAKPFVRALVTGRFPLEEVDKFIDGKKSSVEDSLSGSSGDDKKLNIDTTEIHSQTVIPAIETAEELPILSAKEALEALDKAVEICADQEAVDFLVASGSRKLWQHAFSEEKVAIEQAKGFSGGEYAENVKAKFLEEYQMARDLVIPEGYSFKISGEVMPPNLMQRLVACRIIQHRRVGNWSGTGAGKTLSAILASKILGSKLTVICCPNSVVEGWAREIPRIFPGSIVATKSFKPSWENKEKRVAAHFLILNHEAFQQPRSENDLIQFMETEDVDFIAVDEIHHTKQRYTENLSQRKKLITAFISIAGAKNPHLCVVGMSATPVINNLTEGKHLVEMITGIHHDDLSVTATVHNCMKMHQRLVTLGIRWVPKYNIEVERIEPEVDCAAFLEEIRALGHGASPHALEVILTKARLPEILKNIRRKTLIYTHLISEIDKILLEAIKAAGWKVGFYTGEDKFGLSQFIDGDLDVLIGTSAISTGVDRLQHVCDNLIINVLPWTHAEYEQLLGRIYRQGQRETKIRVIIPKTFAVVNGQRWSWCESKLERLKFKKSIADAAVDGIVPDGHLRSPAQSVKDVMDWLTRIETGQVLTLERTAIAIPKLSISKLASEQLRRASDFSVINGRWNSSLSVTTFERLKTDPAEWQSYHALYRDIRKGWTEIPYERFIGWLNNRPERVVGDFGCGEALIAKNVSNTVHSFDFVAIDEDVVACDMCNTGLENECLDVAIFSLSLMGKNWVEYLKEAYRTLKVDGILKIAEPMGKWEEERRSLLVSAIREIGFRQVGEIEESGKFIYLDALKA